MNRSHNKLYTIFTVTAASILKLDNIVLLKAYSCSVYVSPEQGTQSANPHNDYCQHFVDTGQRPQNFIRDVGLADRFEEYPKLRELIKLKVHTMLLSRAKSSVQCDYGSCSKCG